MYASHSWCPTLLTCLLKRRAETGIGSSEKVRRVVGLKGHGEYERAAPSPTRGHTRLCLVGPGPPTWGGGERVSLVGGPSNSAIILVQSLKGS